MGEILKKIRGILDIITGQTEKDLEKLLKVSLRQAKETLSLGRTHIEELGKLDDQIKSKEVQGLLRSNLNGLAQSLFELETNVKSLKEAIQKVEQ